MVKRHVWLIAGLAMCGSPTGPVEVTVRAPSVRIRNATDRPVYYTAIERGSAALIDWVPCTTPPSCSTVAPHAERLVPFDQIAGYEAGEMEAIVYWWHLDATPSGFRVDSMRAEVVWLGAVLSASR